MDAVRGSPDKVSVSTPARTLRYRVAELECPLADCIARGLSSDVLQRGDVFGELGLSLYPLELREVPRLDGVRVHERPLFGEHALAVHLDKRRSPLADFVHRFLAFAVLFSASHSRRPSI